MASRHRNAAVHRGDDGLGETSALAADSRDLFSPGMRYEPTRSGKRAPASGSQGYLWASLQLAVQYVRASVRRDRQGFCVGLFTVALVVAFTSLVQSAVDNSPVVFLKLSEDTAGEGDLVLLPDPQVAALAAGTPQANASASASASASANATATPAGSAAGGGLQQLVPSGVLLNDTDIAARLAAVPAVEGVAPRWTVFGRLLSARSRQINTTAIILVADTAREAAIGLGRTWGRRAPGPAEAYVSQSALDEMGVRGAAGEQVDVEIDLGSLLSTAGLAGSGDGSAGTGSAASLLSLLASAGVEVGRPDGQGGRVVDVDATALLQAEAAAPFLAALGIDPAALPSLGTVSLNVTALLQAALDTGAAAGDASAAAGAPVAAASAGALVLSKRVTVVEGVAAPSGKWPAFLGNVVVLEASHVASWLGQEAAAAAAQVLAVLEPLSGGAAGGGTAGAVSALRAFEAAALAFDLDTMRQFSLQEYVVMRGRLGLYLGDPNGAERGVARLADDVAAALGPSYAAQATAPLASALGSTAFIKLFLDQVFGTVVFVLGLLGSLVIFALVLGDVEQRTYEYGMLRALGLRHRTLSALLAVSSAAFAVPGIVLGLAAASALHGGLVALFWQLTATLIPGTLSAGAWVLGLVLGVVMPAAANVIPIRRALTSTLRDSLDLYHQTINEMSVTIRRLSEVGISATQAAVSLVLVVVGFVTFYVLPLAFATRQFPVFLGVLSAVLVGMLLGLSVVGATLQPTVETAIGRCLLAAAGRARLSTVVSKNLAAHRRRNAKTAYMVSISTAFVVFAGAMFSLQAASIESNFKLFLGADIVAVAPAATGSAALASQQAAVMPQQSLTEYLSAEAARSAAAAARAPAGAPASVSGATVQSFTFIAQDVGSTAPSTSTRLSPLPLVPSRRSAVTAVQRNYLSVAYGEFTTITETSPTTAEVVTGTSTSTATSTSAASGSATDDVIQRLYAAAGRQRLPLERTAETFLASQQALALGPWFHPVYACGITTWPEALAAGGASATFWTWRSCNASCSGGNSSSSGSSGSSSSSGSSGSSSSSGSSGSSGGSSGGTDRASTCFELPAMNSSLVDAVSSLFYSEYVDAIASEAVRDTLSLSTSNGAVIAHYAANRTAGTTSGTRSLVKLAAMVSKMAGFGFTPFGQTASGSPLLVRGQDAEAILRRAELVLQSRSDPPVAAAWRGSSQSAWRVVVTQAENAPASSPRAGALELAELQLLASGGAATPCDAEALAAAADDSSPTLPKGRLMVRLYPGTSPVQRSRVVNSLRNRMPDDSFRVEDTAALLTAAATAIQGLDAFFYVVAVVCLVLCFFAVWLSFAANIRENSREVGILRSLGLTKPNVRLLVAAEALSVVSAAFLSGSVIGMAISVSLSLQFNLFTQLPFVFRFPTGMFVGTLVLCVVVAVAGSLLPLRRFLQLEIAPVAKGRA
ncbi:hypothetical protein FNF29_02505 [Cafeteria roenbergensis]|uniref:ABC3 transporter permease C-terminal domain-containing protein n=1 Tax=Cafeteria roenbergensis TaxID=33653 RepID=A0A5A8CMJ9_CAFRO|nr:hypothetical protein FNF29_02505 [Cafeteria roenbergensis]|eukprot:KAA0154285.1 hypothetical protein FNF29_02505 [Cafeteria roenbergensis]